MLELNYNVHVIADGVSSCNKEETPIALAGIRQAGGHITTSESAAFQLQRKRYLCIAVCTLSMLELTTIGVFFQGTRRKRLSEVSLGLSRRKKIPLRKVWWYYARIEACCSISGSFETLWRKMNIFLYSLPLIHVIESFIASTHRQISYCIHNQIHCSTCWAN